MNEYQLLRLQRVEVDGLFGIYDHSIDLNLPDRVTLLHGRNGVGKTTVLRMINAFLRGDITYFGRNSFRSFFPGFSGWQQPRVGAHRFEYRERYGHSHIGNGRTGKNSTIM